MRALSAAELLEVWERAAAEPPVLRSLAVLAAASPETAPEALGRLSVGEHDARLLTLREWTFGPRLAALTDCPACGERLELDFEVGALRADPAAGDDDTLAAEGWEVSFRVPTCEDLVAASAARDAAHAERLLLERCVLSARHAGEERPAAALPPAVVEAVGERMAAADPQADLRARVRCEACAHEWLVALDVAWMFWTEIDAWAAGVVRDVHALATAYGWREADVLALGPRRRRLYLELAGR